MFSPGPEPTLPTTGTYSITPQPRVEQGDWDRVTHHPPALPVEIRPYMCSSVTQTFFSASASVIGIRLARSLMPGCFAVLAEPQQGSGIHGEMAGFYNRDKAAGFQITPCSLTFCEMLNLRPARLPGPGCNLTIWEASRRR